MKRFLALLLLAGAAHAQTPPAYKVYSCPTIPGAIGTNAKNFTSCGSSAWSWQLPPRRDADAPLVAACTTCGWGTNHTVTWKRPRDVAANEFVSTCTSNVAVGSRSNCATEPFVLRDAVLLAPAEPPPPPPPDPVPPVATLSASPAWIYTGDSVTLTWTTANVASCLTTWTTSTPFGGTAVVGPNLAPGLTLEFTIRCLGTSPVYPDTQATVNVEVRQRSPRRWIHNEHEGKIRVWLLSTPHPKYDSKATWCYSTPEGVRQETWAFSSVKALRRFYAEKMGQRYDEAEAAAECERECEIIPPGPLKDELDAWAAEWNCERLGFID